MQYRRLLIMCISFIYIFFAYGCEPPPPVRFPDKPPPPPAVSFPPQKVMESGDYQGFITENLNMLKQCNGVEQCEATALFNMGFVHAYSRSPYFNSAKALKYFGTLIKKYPDSPWAFQATAWLDLVKRHTASESTRRRLLGELKAKEEAIKYKEEAIKGKEMELKDRETSIQDRETTINELQQQIKRSREIDEEIEQKERELLQ